MSDEVVHVSIDEVLLLGCAVSRSQLIDLIVRDLYEGLFFQLKLDHLIFRHFHQFGVAIKL